MSVPNCILLNLTQFSTCIVPTKFTKISSFIMNMIKRAKAPTPKFFKVLRNIGLALAALGGTILAAPMALPVVLTSVMR